MTFTSGSLLSARFAQMGYVTNDIGRAIEVFGEKAGVRKFLRNDDVRFQVGPGQDAHCNVALAVSGGVQIELIHPLGEADRVYREFLTGDGFQLRFHHECHWVDTEAEFAAAKAEMRRHGHEIVIDGVNPFAKYFYADLRSLFGHYVEYVCFNPETVEELNKAIPVN